MPPSLIGTCVLFCLPDGDDDVLTDGCVRFASVRDTSAEPSGFIFLGSGEEAFVPQDQRRIESDASAAGSRRSQA
jgi:hypothetical protein